MTRFRPPLMQTRNESAPAAPIAPADFARVWEKLEPLVCRGPAGGCGLPLPDWKAIDDCLRADFPHLDPDALWTRLADEWMSRAADALGEGWCVDESRNFLLLSTFPQARARYVLQFLEETFHHLREFLPVEVTGTLLGRCPVLAFDDHDRFVAYLADFYPGEEGEWSAPGGVYLNRGYGHIALPPLLEDAFVPALKTVLSHELTHALLMALPLPLWLNEAMAMTAEAEITRHDSHPLDQEVIRRHRAYWNAERMQAFWKGDSFVFPDEGSELSYSLARFLFKALLDGGRTKRPQIAELLTTASYHDAGFGAVETIFGAHLDELLRDFLGPGDWRPSEPLFVEQP